MKKLLMATDLSARSDRALERSVTIAREHDAQLTIVHVVDEDLSPPLADAQELAARKAIQEHVDGLTEGKGPDVSIKVVFGRTYIDILDLAEETETEMVVLGMHREDSFKDTFRGTTVERVSRVSKVPTLLVKERVSKPYQQVIVAVDFSVYSRRAVEFAMKFAPGGEFRLVHAYDVPFEGFIHGQGVRKNANKQHQTQFKKMIDEEMASFLTSVETNGTKIERVMQEGTVQEVIHRQITRQKPDLLVIGTHGRTGVAHAFLGSVAETLLRSPPCDVLTVKAW